MAVSVIERFDSRETTDLSSQGDTIRLRYFVTGTTDDATAHTSLVDALPAVYRGLLLDRVKLTRTGIEIWEGEAEYKDSQSPQSQQQQQKPLSKEYEWRFEFDTTGGMHHVTQSIETVSSHVGALGGGAALVAPDFNGAIGVSGDTVEGVDIIVPALRFTITMRVPNAILSTAYAKEVSRLTGHVNDSEFLDFAAGELLFEGGNGSQASGGGDPEVSFHFTANENATIVLDSIGEVPKDGHHYLWVLYEATEDSEAKKLVRRPYAAYVERVYKDGDFSVLNILAGNQQI